MLCCNGMLSALCLTSILFFLSCAAREWRKVVRQVPQRRLHRRGGRTWTQFVLPAVLFAVACCRLPIWLAVTFFRPFSVRRHAMRFAVALCLSVACCVSHCRSLACCGSQGLSDSNAPALVTLIRSVFRFVGSSYCSNVSWATAAACARTATRDTDARFAVFLRIVCLVPLFAGTLQILLLVEVSHCGWL